MGFAAPQNCASMSQLNVSRFVELHDLGGSGQRPIQCPRPASQRDTGVFSRLLAIYGYHKPWAARPFSCQRPPSPTRKAEFGADYVSKRWAAREVINSDGGKGRAGIGGKHRGFIVIISQ